jgi:hypothetical protein
MPEYLYGRHAILEALRAGRPIEEIQIAMGVHARGALRTRTYRSAASRAMIWIG